jgi:hypothetical protein
VSDRLRSLSLAIDLATLELRLDAFIWELERRYRPDQPRAPKGTPIGGRWIRDGSQPSDRRKRTAMAGRLILDRVGLSDDGRLVRHCIYQDMLGRQYGFEQDASVDCPLTYVTKPYWGPY